MTGQSPTLIKLLGLYAVVALTSARAAHADNIELRIATLAPSGAIRNWLTEPFGRPRPTGTALVLPPLRGVSIHIPCDEATQSSSRASQLSEATLPPYGRGRHAVSPAPRWTRP